jgi:putative tricarboxylic transport membrane protein
MTAANTSTMNTATSGATRSLRYNVACVLLMNGWLQKDHNDLLDHNSDLAHCEGEHLPIVTRSRGTNRQSRSSSRGEIEVTVNGCLTAPPSAARRSWPRLALALVVPVALSMSACGKPADSTTDPTADALAYPTGNLNIMVPADPGGGFDGLGRAVQAALKDSGLVTSSIDISNEPGAGGTIGLTKLISSHNGNSHQLMITGYTTVGAAVLNKTAKLTDATPIATLTEEAAVLVVAASSPYQTLADVVQAWKADPKSVKFAGGSLGGPDHIAVSLLAKAAGINTAAVKDSYAPYAGTPKEALSAGVAQVLVSGISELEDLVKSGDGRALAVTAAAAQDVAGSSVSTIKDAGYDVVVTNWRGIVAPPGISDAEREAIVSLIDKMHASQQWKDLVEQRGWTDAFRSGDEATEFFKSQVDTGGSILAEVGAV